MAFGKKNVIKLDPLQYNIGLIGEGGIGKTTIIKEMCEKLVGDDGYLFVECGKEDGADAISDINYINCPDWGSEYDEFNNSVGFKILIDDIIENKTTDYPRLKTVVVDTYDQLRQIAEPEVIRLHNKQHPDKKVTSIRSAFGGFMAGDDYCDDMILNSLWSLKNVGVHFIIIGHVKQRDNIIDAINGDTYSQLSTDMSMRSFNKIKTKLHFLGVAAVDREIAKEKKNGKDKNVIKSESRRITFRDNNYAIDSKSRFADIVDNIPMDADALIEALTDAIKKEAEKSKNLKMEDIEKVQAERDAQSEKKSESFSKNAKATSSNKIDPSRNEELKIVIQTGFKSLANKDEFKALMAECGVTGFKDVSEIPTATMEKLAAYFG